MNKDKYIIINKTAIQQRIEELEEDIRFLDNEEPSDYPDIKKKVLIQNKKELSILKQILSQSTPLIPEIEKAYFEGECYGIGTDACTTKQDYVSNLKLDI